MRLKHLMLGTVAALAAAGTANAGINTPTGWYMSLGAGMNWIEDGTITEFDPPGVFETAMQFSWDDGFVATGAVGYDFGEHWRVEFEVAYRDNDADGFCTSAGRSCTVGNTDVWELSQMVNVMYDIGLGGNWEASAGAGIGGNLVTLKSSSFFDPSSSEDDDYVLAGQLIAQVGYRLAERWQLYLDYHYMFMDDLDFQNPGDPIDVFEMEKTDHSLLLGIRFDLQRDGAAPTHSDPVRPAPKQFIVFFGFNKSNLTNEAQRVVSEAAAAAKEFGSASISVIGHTDTVGSNDYNVRLSIRRSQAVKDALVSLGIAASSISTGGRGEAELMVQTGDSVKEPQNRRATIDLN